MQVHGSDCILIDTKICYRCTELEHDSTENSQSWIVSIVRDFYLSVPCPEDMEEGHVLIEEDDIPEDMPLRLNADTANCALAEIEDEETGESYKPDSREVGGVVQGDKYDDADTMHSIIHTKMVTMV